MSTIRGTDVSIIIITYNRNESLKRTLGSIKDMTVPGTISWELIVVDNNSRDKTKACVEEFRIQSGLRVVYAFEKEQGVSYARNRGIREARGQIIAFADDDVLVSRDWLVNIVKAFDESDAAAVGGKILPLWEKTPPQWLSRELYGCLALLDYGDEWLGMTKPDIWTANSAFKAAAFHDHGYFDSSLQRGEDVEFIERLLQREEKVYYCPQMVVHHCIPESRMTRQYFRKWEYNYGVYRGFKLRHAGSWRSNLRALKNMMLNLGIYLSLRFIRTEEAFMSQRMFAQNLGFIVGRMKARYQSPWMQRGHVTH